MRDKLAIVRGGGDLATGIIYRLWRDGRLIGVLVDPEGSSIETMKPDLVVDATMMKRYTGTNRSMAPLVLAVGPGFSAPDQVHGVIETKRGHYLGRLILDGAAIPNTGVPGMEMGYTVERLLRAPAKGFVVPGRSIGDHVEAGELIAHVSGHEVRANLSGVLRGLIHPSVLVEEGLKIGDIDPRNDSDHCFSITGKALAIAGGVLEAVMTSDFVRLN